MVRTAPVSFVSIVIIAFLILPFVSCGQPSAPSAPAAAPTKAAAEAVPAKESVVIALSQEPDTLIQDVGSMYFASVVKAALGTHSVNSSTAVLVWRNDKNEIVPGIAESVPTIENGGAKFVGEGENKHLEVTFKLRKDVKWHDATPVTSKDVKFRWETVMDPTFPISDRSTEQKIATMDTPDDYTVILKYMSQKEAREAARTGGRLGKPEAYKGFDKQEGPVLDPLYNRPVGVTPQHLYSKIKAADLSKSEYARKPMGMGPYKLKEWVAGQSITLEANPDYFLGAPKIKTLIFKIIPDTNTILAQLQAGAVDVVTEGSIQLDNAPDLDRIAAAGVVKPYYLPATVWEHLDFNNEHEFLKEPNVRKAIAYAIDRKSIVDKVLYGKTQVIHSWIVPMLWAYSDTITKYDYNKDKAAQLLKDAGFTPGPDGTLAKGGKPLRLKLQTTSGQKLRELTTQIIQQNLKEVGIAVDLDFMPSQNFFATEGKGPLNNGTFEMAIFGWVAGDDPAGVGLYHSKSIPTKDNAYAGQNMPRWKNARNDELLQKATDLLGQTERKPLYAEQQKIFSDDLPLLPLYQRPNISVANVKLQNYRPTPTNTPPTWNVHEWFLPAR
ncbi:MAG: peptide ABC transporter substrate-binding protein [Chloroflexi bacterium]|nr:peptide ABC transporter substrate-binding protein [Chloroflexota bacterium]